ncbi:hypothetical protein E1281_32325 [Actinomadura sp. KC345]|uniref:hypothetical protein n=1 Tax=Actinomadura sp. KC345 TaxID=2530371 RepID=UPI001053F02A|nr:hypothetical protein [Actinomadura sp. KC345]TDC44873.1 hypothetical protein E1281_32325 [Actinomadura sp. KC345]
MTVWLRLRRMGGGHAHYVVLDGKQRRVWSRRRGALSLFTDVLWGPERTLEFIQSQEGGTPDFWMNSVWWQGVLLVDLRKRQMLVHTFHEMDDHHTSVHEIRAWLRIVRGLWPRGWEIAWIPRGLHEVMDHLGLPYDTVLYLDEPMIAPPRSQWALPPAEDDDLAAAAETVVAVRGTGGRLSFGGLWINGMDEMLLHGPARLEIEQEEAADCAVLGAVPRNGAYLDVGSRRLDWWALDCPHDRRLVESQWTGWTLTDHGDDYAEVARLAGPDFVIEGGSEGDACGLWGSGSGPGRPPPPTGPPWARSSRRCPAPVTDPLLHAGP